MYILKGVKFSFFRIKRIDHRKNSFFGFDDYNLKFNVDLALIKF